MKQSLAQTGTVVAVDFARGTIPVGCDAGFYQRLLEALSGTLQHLHSQVPEGRELVDVGTVVCEDNRSLCTYGYFDGSYCMADVAAGVEGIEYSRDNPATHPENIDHALRWLATKQQALN